MIKSMDLQQETLNFAQEIITFYKSLVFDYKEFVISKRILKCGTSIGIKILRSEMKGALNLAIETDFWLQLLKNENDSLSDEVNEIINKNKNIINHLEINLNRYC